MFLVNRKYFVHLSIKLSLNVSQRTSEICQTADGEFTGLIPLNTVLMFHEVLNLSLHLPSVDFN